MAGISGVGASDARISYNAPNDSSAAAVGGATLLDALQLARATSVRGPANYIVETQEDAYRTAQGLIDYQASGTSAIILRDRETGKFIVDGPYASQAEAVDAVQNYDFENKFEYVGILTTP